MDEFIQIALFLLFALFSLGSNLLKKRREQKAKEQAEEETYEENGGRPPRRAEVSSPDEPEDSRQFTTFEDILRELTGENPRRERPKRKPEPRQEAEEVEEDAYDHPFSNKKIQEAEQKAERKVAQKVEPLRQYKQKAKKYQGHVAQKISDKIKIDDASPAKKLVVKKTATKKKNKQLARSIAASLKNPKSAGKAIILGEILNRKHF